MSLKATSMNSPAVHISSEEPPLVKFGWACPPHGEPLLAKCSDAVLTRVCKIIKDDERREVDGNSIVTAQLLHLS